MSGKPKTITICSSSSMYQEAVKLRDKLSQKGFKVLVPKMADEMAAKNNFERTHFQPWLKDESKYQVKADLIHGHLDKVAEADATLVLNGKKHGIENYIGGNVLMEMALAFHLKQPIFIYNEIPKESAYLEEIKGVLPIPLHGKLDGLIDYFKQG